MYFTILLSFFMTSYNNNVEIYFIVIQVAYNL